MTAAGVLAMQVCGQYESPLSKQNDDGGWTPEGEEGGGGRIYASCMAKLSLSVNYN